MAPADALACGGTPADPGPLPIKLTNDHGNECIIIGPTSFTGTCCEWLFWTSQKPIGAGNFGYEVNLLTGAISLESDTLDLVAGPRLTPAADPWGVDPFLEGVRPPRPGPRNRSVVSPSLSPTRPSV